MLIRLITLGLICSCEVLYAQQVTLRGRIIDENLQPVKYVSIGIVNKPIGTVSDETGTFMLRFNRDSITANDSLKLSSIGYHSKSVCLYQTLNNEVKQDNNLIITLNQKPVGLSELVIFSERRTTKTIGTHKKSLMTFYVNFAQPDRSNQNLGSEIGRRFPISKKNTTIEALKFFISQNNFDSVKLRVNVYSIKRGKPDQNLLNENIYIDIKNRRKGWIEVDLTQYGIVVSEKVIVSVEWVSKSATGSILTLPVVMPTTHIHFYKYGSQNKWKRFNSMSTYMELKIRE